MAKFAEMLPDPQAQKEYEAALGELLVAFNHLENWVRTAVEFYFKENNLHSVWKEIDYFKFSKLVELYASMFTSSDDMPQLDKSKAKGFGEERNKYAHAQYLLGPRKHGAHIVTKNGRIKVDIVKMKKKSEEIREYTDELWSDLYPIMFP